MKSLFRNLFGKWVWVNYSNTLDYRGTWRGGRFHGFGQLKYKSGSIYEGNFHAGSKHGFGRLISPNGYEYHGYWWRGHPHGDAFIRYKTGNTYEGSVKDSLRHGYGKLWDVQTGLELSGKWVVGKLEGTVEITSKKWTYLGPLPISDEPVEAIMKYDDGSVYKGGLLDFKRQGNGRLTFSSGEYIQGKWFENENVFNATQLDHQGAMWEGNLLGLKPHGYMKVSFPSGSKYNGLWNRGDMVGTLSVRKRREKRLQERAYH